jgi:hypothetical protein
MGLVLVLVVVVTLMLLGSLAVLGAVALPVVLLLGILAVAAWLGFNAVRGDSPPELVRESRTQDEILDDRD